MGKTIIKNNSRISNMRAMFFVRGVIVKGRISKAGTCYCLHTEFTDSNIRIICNRTKTGADVFRVEDVK